MQTVLITGGAGYIGSTTAALFIKMGHRVVIIDDLSTGFKELVPDHAIFYRESILNKEKVHEIILNEKITAIVHFAAKTVVPESIEEPLDYYKTNIQGVLSILEACETTSVKYFIFSSTAAVYGNNFYDRVDESIPPSPINPYAKSKLFSENIIRDIAGKLGIRNIILRYFNVAGASSNGKHGQMAKNATHIIKLLSEVACGKRELFEITGTDFDTIDGTGVRDYIHVEDLASAHYSALIHLENGGPSDLFNVGYGRGVSVMEVVDTMRLVTGKEIKTTNAPQRPGDARQVVADANRILAVLGWKPKYDDLKIICKSAYEFEKKLSHKP